MAETYLTPPDGRRGCTGPLNPRAVAVMGDNHIELRQLRRGDTQVCFSFDFHALRTCTQT